jgi:hypothetical protein
MQSTHTKMRPHYSLMNYETISTQNDINNNTGVLHDDGRIIDRNMRR